MMSQEFENYYLQTKGASLWETIEEAQKLDSLVVKLEDKKADFSGFKVRIIGASFDEENSIWKNQQLFFSRNCINILPILQNTCATVYQFLKLFVIYKGIRLDYRIPSQNYEHYF